LRDEEFLGISCYQVEFFFLSLTFFPTPLSLSLSRCVQNQSSENSLANETTHLCKSSPEETIKFKFA